MYATSGTTVYVNLFASSEARVTIERHARPR